MSFTGEELKYRRMMMDYTHLMDHTEEFYHVMKLADDAIASSDLPVVEVGTRAGGSAMCFMELIYRRDKSNWVYTIDPYGAIPWSPKEGVVLEKSGYVNKFYRQAMAEIGTMAFQKEINHHHFRCTSKEFMDWVYPNFTQYDDDGTSKLDQFCFVYIDADNRWSSVKAELDFFLPKTTGCVIIDDTQHTLQQLEEYCEGRYHLTHMNKRSHVRHL